MLSVQLMLNVNYINDCIRVINIVKTITHLRVVKRPLGFGTCNILFTYFSQHNKAKF